MPLPPRRALAEGFLKVKLMRGFIGVDKTLAENARCIGLRKRFQTSYIPLVPEAVGNLLKIKELVRVEYVMDKPRLDEPLYSRGYKVVGSLLHCGSRSDKRLTS